MLGSLATNLVPSPHHSFGPLFLYPKFLQSLSLSPFQNCSLVKRNPITQMILREVLTVIWE